MSLDTTAVNRSLHQFAKGEQVWLFGYGSLIFKADFPFIERRGARIEGWARRFWQGSHDHRGTTQQPGRVVTLVKCAGVWCHGVAYLVSHQVFEQLDVREKNGYLRIATGIEFDDRTTTPGLVYIADPDNQAYLGPAPAHVIAAQIATAAGPSGPNRDYLFDLARALRDMRQHDEHVFAIERALLDLSANRTAA